MSASPSRLPFASLLAGATGIGFAPLFVRLSEVGPSMGGEDFSEFGRTADKIPVCMFWLGSVEPDRVAESERTGKPLPSLHSSLFRPMPEPTIKAGITAMTAAVLELLGS